MSASNVTCLATYHSEIQKHVKGVFPSAECVETLHIIDGTYSKCITIPFISDALDWFVVTAVNSHMLMRVICSCPMNKQKEKFNKKVCAKGA